MHRSWGAPSFKIFMNTTAGERARASAFPISTTAICLPLRGCGAGERRRLPAPRDDRDRLGAAQPREAARPAQAQQAVPCGPGTHQDRISSRPTPSSARPTSPVSTSQDPHCSTRHRQRALEVVSCSAGLALRLPSRHARITSPMMRSGAWQHRRRSTAATAQPPRSRAALWQGISDGHVDIIGTDHIVVTRRARPVRSGMRRPAVRVWKRCAGDAQGGHHKRKLPLSRIAALTAGNAARAWGSATAKARSRPGWTRISRWSILERNGRSICRNLRSSAATRSMKDIASGDVRHSILRGRFILRDGQLVEAAVGQGRYLPRALTAQA